MDIFSDWRLSLCVRILAIPSVMIGLSSCGNSSGSPVAVMPEDPFAVSLPVLMDEIRITEFMYSGANDEFVEFTNVGSTVVDMTGWSFDDDSRTPDTVALSSFGMVQPGESVILSESSAEDFRTNWNLCPGIKIIGGLTTNLGRNDEINLFDAADNLADRLAYGDETFTGTIRTQNASGWVSDAGLGNNMISEWILSTVSDAEGSFASSGGDIGSPGESTRATVIFEPDCDDEVVDPNAPTIEVADTTTSFLNLNAMTPGSLSGVLGDPTDPGSTSGIDFTLTDADTPLADLTVTATSSDPTVVPDGNLVFSGTEGSRNLKITPVGVGLITITVTVSDGSSSAIYTIDYAASAASVNAATTRFMTGSCDASTAIAVDSDFMIVGDDEDQALRLHDRTNSGYLFNSFDFTSMLGISPGDEVDIEASTRSGNTIYWLGSHSNSSGGNDRPERERLFSTTLSGSGSSASLAFGGSYDGLEDDLIDWDDANGHGLGAGALGLAASAAAGMVPEGANGFNIEGLTLAPDGTTGYLGFRAPLQTPATRTQALIVPVTNFTSLPGGSGPATFGVPIFLNLGEERGIRSIERNASNEYLIIAGTATAGNDFRLYTWTGIPTDAPIEVTGTDLTSLQSGGSFETIVEMPASLGNGSQVQLLVDNGDTVYYGDSTICKDLSDDNLKKFRSEVVTLSGIVPPVSSCESAPVLVSSVPAAGSRSVPRNTQIRLTYDQPIAKGTGSIILRRRFLPFLDTRTTDISSSRVEIEGNDLILTVSGRGTRLNRLSLYDFSLPAGAVTCESGALPAGPVNFSFTTGVN